VAWLINLSQFRYHKFWRSLSQLQQQYFALKQFLSENVLGKLVEIE